MRLFSFLSKRDAKIVANSIAAVFQKVNGEYDVAYATIANHWAKQEDGLRKR